VGEGLAQGAIMGAYGALANLADEGYGERLSARADANQALATGSNVVGAVLPSLLSGGVGSAGALARLTPAGQLANLSTKLGVALSARAATGIGRIGALAATGAVEGALDNATRTVLYDITRGNVDITAERALDAMWEGAKWGGAISGGIGALAEGIGATARGVGSLLSRKAPGVADDIVPPAGVTGAADNAAAQLDNGRPMPTPEPLPVEALGDFDPVKAQEARPLISSDMPDVDPGFLANVRASRGTYEQSLDDGVADITRLSDSIQDDLDHIDEYAGIAAKRRLAEKTTYNAPVAAGDALMPVQAMQADLDQLTAKYSRAALQGKGGLGAIERVKGAIKDTSAFVTDALAKGEIGKANMALDDLKRIVGDAAGSKNNLLAGVFERQYETLQKALEDVDTWGDLAARQKPVNGSWWERIKRQTDQRIQGLFVKNSGESAANPFKRLTKTNDASVNTLLQGLGDRGTAGQEEAFRRYLRSAVEDANTRARAWGTPDLVERAERIRDAAAKIEQRMDETFLLKNAAGKWEGQKRAVGEWTQSIPFLGALAKGGTWAAERAAQVMPASPGANTVADATALAMASGAVKQERRVAEAAKATIAGLAKVGKRVAMAAPGAAAKAAAAPSKEIEKMIAQARALQDPESDESHQLEAMTLQMASDSPELADAIKAKVMQKADFVVRTLGPSTDPADPLGRQPMPMDRITRGRNERFMRAVQSPGAALERLARGEGSAEDLAVVKEVTPQLHKRWADQVIESMVSGNVRPTMAQRQRLLFMLGQPVERAQTPDFVRFFQQLHQQQTPSEDGAQQPGQAPQPRAPSFSPKEFKVDGHYASRTDQLMGGPGGDG